MCFSPLRLQVVKTLILYGAEVDARDFSGQTPLYFAAELGKLNMTALLLEASYKSKLWAVLIKLVKAKFFLASSLI